LRFPETGPQLGLAEYIGILENPELDRGGNCSQPRSTFRFLPAATVMSPNTLLARKPLTLTSRDLRDTPLPIYGSRSGNFRESFGGPTPPDQM
jgi:hypothetical protein